MKDHANGSLREHKRTAQVAKANNEETPERCSEELRQDPLHLPGHCRPHPEEEQGEGRRWQRRGVK